MVATCYHCTTAYSHCEVIWLHNYFVLDSCSIAPAILLTVDNLSFKAMEKQAADCDITEMDSEDELFIMYTSGTTCRAKGIVHTHAGYLLYVATTHKVSMYLTSC